MLFWHLGITAAIIFATIGRRRVDYRVVLLGAILPDLIDKPLGRILFEEEFQSSRIFGHTLLFSFGMLLVVMLTMRGATARRWFILPIACLIHLGLDAMWNHPITLFWPVFGDFPPEPVEGYWWEVLLRPFRHPLEGLKELAGLVALIYLYLGTGLSDRAIRRTFFKTGEIPARSPADERV